MGRISLMAKEWMSLWVKEADVQGTLREPAVFWSNGQLGRTGAGEGVGEREREQMRLGDNGWGAGRTHGILNIRLRGLWFILM